MIGLRKNFKKPKILDKINNKKVNKNQKQLRALKVNLNFNLLNNSNNLQ